MILDLVPSIPTDPIPAPAASPMSLVSDFASLARRCDRPDTLLAEAAQALASALPFSHIVLVDGAGSPLQVRHAAAVGWTISPQELGTILLRLSPYADWAADGPGPDASRCRIVELRGPALTDLSASLPRRVPSDAFASAIAIGTALRGHLIAALLVTSTPRSVLSGEDRHTVSAVFAILETAFELALRKRDYTRRLRQIRRAKIAWEGTVDALPQILCVLDKEGKVIRANRAIEVWGLGSVRSAPFGALHDLLHPGCRASECRLAEGLTALVREGAGPENRQLLYADARLGRDLRIEIGRIARGCVEAQSTPCSRRFAVIEDITVERISGPTTPELPRAPHRALECGSEVVKKSIFGPTWRQRCASRGAENREAVGKPSSGNGRANRQDSRRNRLHLLLSMPYAVTAVPLDAPSP